MSPQEVIKTLIVTHQRRLEKLQLQQAELGISTPPEILTQIEDIELEIEGLQTQLEEIKSGEAEDDSKPISQVISMPAVAPAQPEKFGKKRLALLIGNTNFEDNQTFHTLYTPANDVEDFAETLRTYGNFEPVKTLVDARADTIKRAIDNLFNQAEYDDLVLLYYSGHGYRGHDGRHYLIAEDSQSDLILSSGIQDTFIHDALKNSRAQHRVIILDCCFSGAFVSGRKGGTGEPLLLEELAGEGTVVLASSNTIQHSFLEETCHNSLFTRYLLRGINTGQADNDQDGFISIDELFKYVDQNVRYTRPDQSPLKTVSNGEGEIIIARNPHNPAIKLPADIEAMLPSEDRDTQQVARKRLKELAQGDNKALAILARETLEELPKIMDEDISEAPPVQKPAPISEPDQRPTIYQSSFFMSALAIIILAAGIVGVAINYNQIISPKFEIQELGGNDFSNPGDLPGPSIPLKVPYRTHTWGTTKFIKGYNRYLWFIVCDQENFSCVAWKLKVYNSKRWDTTVSIGSHGAEDSCKIFEVAFAVVDEKTDQLFSNLDARMIQYNELPDFQDIQWYYVIREPDKNSPNSC